MEEKIMRKVRVKRIKKEPKLRHVKAKRIKPKEVLNLEQMRKVRVVRFEKEYHRFMSLGKSPDDYVENITNKIAFLYMYSKNVGMDPSIVKERLKEINYSDFIKIYVETSPAKLYALGVYRKIHNGAILLLNLLVHLNIENDKKIKLPMSLVELRNAIYRKSFYEHAPKADYDIEGLRRISLVKDGLMIPLDDEKIESSLEAISDIKNCTMMIEYETCRFLSIPMKYFKKILEINELEFFSLLIVDKDPEASRHSYEFEELDELSNIVKYENYKRANGFQEIINLIMKYDEFIKSVDDYGYITSTGCYCSFEEVIFNDKKNNISKVPYDDFIEEFFPFIRL